MLVFGGSLGARSINLAAIEAYAGATFHVLHICGRRDHPELVALPRPLGYDLREYLDLAEFAQALAAADLVVARAGGSLFEVAAHGRPAILIPYPHAAADHQAANARWMEQGGAAVVVPDGELSAARLARETAALLADPQRHARNGGRRPAPCPARRGRGGGGGVAGGGAGMSRLAEGWSWSGWSGVGKGGWVCVWRGLVGRWSERWLVGRWTERVEACAR